MKKFKLKYLFIKGFKSESTIVELDFSDGPVSVIYGVNGSGKTTILKIIQAILNKDEEILFNENINSIRVGYFIGKEEKEIFIIRNSEDGIENSSHGTKSIYNWGNYKESEINYVTSILFGVNRGLITKFNFKWEDIYSFISSGYRDIFPNARRAREFSRDLESELKLQYRRNYKKITSEHDFKSRNVRVDDIEINVVKSIIQKRYQVAKNLTTQRVQKALFDTLLLAINPERKRKNVEIIFTEFEFRDELELYKDKLIEALEDTTDNELKDDLINILKNQDIEILMNQCFKSSLLTQLLYRMMNELKKEKDILESINLLEEIFNSHLEENKKLVITSNDIYVKLKSNQHSLNDLSSGERHLLTFLTIFLIEAREKDILLIDEPELSLNVKWQREILPLIHRLAPETQIIVASHSPSIVKKDTNYLVKLYRGDINE